MTKIKNNDKGKKKFKKSQKEKEEQRELKSRESCVVESTEHRVSRS